MADARARIGHYAYMNTAAQTLASYFDSETAKVLSACTACGKCVEMCPVVPYTGLKEADPKAIAHGVVDKPFHLPSSGVKHFPSNVGNLGILGR
jgi:ferredoxin